MGWEGGRECEKGGGWVGEGWEGVSRLRGAGHGDGGKGVGPGVARGLGSPAATAGPVVGQPTNQDRALDPTIGGDGHRAWSGPRGMDQALVWGGGPVQGFARTSVGPSTGPGWWWWWWWCEGVSWVGWGGARGRAKGADQPRGPDQLLEQKMVMGHAKNGGGRGC